MQYTQVMARPAQEALGSPFDSADVQCTPRRIMAYLVDTAVLAAAIIGICLLAGWWQTVPYTYVDQFGQTVQTTHVQLNVGFGGWAFLTGLCFGYFVLMEWALAWTIGKLLFGLRVVDPSGGQISFGQSMVRNVLRLVDNLMGGLLGVIVMLCSDRRQRVGDRAAGTLVVRA